jgi:integrase
MRAHLTDAGVRALKAGKRQYRVWDTKTPGFGILVGRTKSWICMYGPKRKLRVLGRYPDMALADARTSAKGLLLEKAGKVPSQTFGEALDRYYELHLPTLRPSSAYNLRTLLERHWSKWERRDLDDIEPREVVLYLDTLTGTPTERHKAFKELRSFYRWCMGRQYADANPCAHLTAPPAPKSRDRVLSDEELAKVWAAAEGMSGNFSRILRLLILTGARRGEIANLRGEYLDRQKRCINLPAEAVKNSHPHTIPYGVLAESILPPARIGWLFPAKGNPQRPFNGFTQPKRQLDAVAGIDFSLHDLRRTMATRWAEFGVAPHIIERALTRPSSSERRSAVDTNRIRVLLDQRDALDKEITAAVSGDKARAPQRCGICHQEGHSSRTCPTKQGGSNAP